ncbi:MAG TPA: hypothetical protein VF657_02140 [Actinoplanes sp.]
MNGHERPLGEQRLLNQLLGHLENDSDDDCLRELATGVRNGDVSLDAALSADAYAESLRPGLTGFADWYHQLDADTRAAEIERSRTQIDKLSEDS